MGKQDRRTISGREFGEAVQKGILNAIREARHLGYTPAHDLNMVVVVDRIKAMNADTLLAEGRQWDQIVSVLEKMVYGVEDEDHRRAEDVIPMPDYTTPTKGVPTVEHYHSVVADAARLRMEVEKKERQRKRLEEETLKIMRILKERTDEKHELAIIANKANRENKLLREQVEMLDERAHDLANRVQKAEYRRELAQEIIKKTNFMFMTKTVAHLQAGFPDLWELVQEYMKFAYVERPRKHKDVQLEIPIQPETDDAEKGSEARRRQAIIPDPHAVYGKDTAEPSIDSEAFDGRWSDGKC